MQVLHLQLRLVSLPDGLLLLHLTKLSFFLKLFKFVAKNSDAFFENHLRIRLFAVLFENSELVRNKLVGCFPVVQVLVQVGFQRQKELILRCNRIVLFNLRVNLLSADNLVVHCHVFKTHFLRFALLAPLLVAFALVDLHMVAAPLKLELLILGSLELECSLLYNLPAFTLHLLKDLLDVCLIEFSEIVTQNFLNCLLYVKRTGSEIVRLWMSVEIKMRANR